MRRDAWFEVGVPQGLRNAQVFGTHWHGLFDNDDSGALAAVS